MFIQALGDSSHPRLARSIAKPAETAAAMNMPFVTYPMSCSATCFSPYEVPHRLIVWRFPCPWSQAGAQELDERPLLEHCRPVP